MPPCTERSVDMFDDWLGTELRRVAWLDHYSPAARRYYLVGGGKWLDFNSGQVSRVNHLFAAMELRWLKVNGRKSKGFIPNIKFVECELTATGKAEFKAWDWSDDDTIAFLERLGEEGYKIGARYDRTNAVWLGSLTCADTANPNFGYCLPARGKSWLHVFAVLAYKHEVLLGGVWTTTKGAGDDDSGWG